MRMRKKRNFDSRISLCSSVILELPENSLIDTSKLSGGKPLYLEIGCGKGQFITTLAARNKDNFYIALEREPNVLLMAAELALKGGSVPENLRFINADAAKLDEIFPPETFERIYINFCDPWRKKKQAKRRLTHRNFHDIYYKLLRKNGEIHFKTDNTQLFQFSLNEFAASDKFRLQNISLDLHAEKTDNIMTEYEQRFAEQGMKICRLEAAKL